LGLGGKDDRAAAEVAFEGIPVNLTFPFAGLAMVRR
jgi:hypothetical protein